MATYEETTGVGLRKVMVFVRDTDGTPAIQGTPAAGVAYGGEPISGAMALTLNVPDPQRVTATGDDKPYFTFQLPPTENPSGELRVTKTNVDAIAILTSTLSWGSASARRIGFATDKVGEEEAMMLWGSREAIDAEEDSVTFGQRVWQTYFILNAKVSIRPASMEYATIGEFVYSLSANPSTLDYFGDQFTEGIQGFTRASFLMIVTLYKYWIDVFYGAGAAGAYTLTHASDVVDPADGGVTSVYVAGEMVAFTEVDGVVTPSVAPGATDKVVVEYTYDD